MPKDNPKDIDVDIDAELEAYDSEHGDTDPGDDTGIDKSGGDDGDTMDVLPGPIPTEGKMTVPPVTEGVLKDEDGGDDGDDKETKPFRTFETQEEYDEFIEAQKNKAIVDRLDKKEPEKEKEPEKREPIKFFEDDWKPENWNDFMNAVVSNPTAAKALADALTPEVKGKLDSLSSEEQEELDKIDKEYDEEYKNLAQREGLPALSTDEGKAISKQIFNIGAKYLVPADGGKARVMTTDEMYQMWASLPEKQGGGLEAVAKKAKVSTRKQRSAFITPARKAQPSQPAKKKASYKHVSETDMDSLIEEGMEEYGD